MKRYNTRNNSKHTKITKKNLHRPPLKVGEYPNLEFYQNIRRSAPEGEFIDNIHKKWAGKFKILENHHSYIQWLFPTFEESGQNELAYPLSIEEAEIMLNNLEVRSKILKSYEMMLHFYGIKLLDQINGDLERSELWRERFKHLNKPKNAHNFMRLTRIIKSLSILGFGVHAVKLVEFLAKEIFMNKTFNNRHVAEASCEKYFIPALPNKTDQKKIIDLVKEYKTKHKKII